MNSNRTVVDLNKVSYANLTYRTKDNTQERFTKPESPTVHGEPVSKECFAAEVKTTSGVIYPKESMYDRAVRRGLIDTWIPHCTLQLSNSHSLTYTGAKALSLWKAWRAKQFGKQNNTTQNYDIIIY